MGTFQKLSFNLYFFSFIESCSDSNLIHWTRFTKDWTRTSLEITQMNFDNSAQNCRYTCSSYRLDALFPLVPVPNSTRLYSHFVNSNSTWLAKFLSETIPTTRRNTVRNALSSCGTSNQGCGSTKSELCQNPFKIRQILPTLKHLSMPFLLTNILEKIWVQKFNFSVCFLKNLFFLRHFYF